MAYVRIVKEVALTVTAVCAAATALKRLFEEKK